MTDSEQKHEDAPSKDKDVAPAAEAVPADQALKDVIVAAFGIGLFASSVIQAKGFSLSDIPALAKLEPSVATVVGELPAIKAQLATMNDAEAEDLALYVGSQVGATVDSAKVVSQVQAAIAFIESGIALKDSFN
jgi:hypothetical protein